MKCAAIPKKCALILPLNLIRINEPQISLIHERRSLQRVSRRVRAA